MTVSTVTHDTFVIVRTARPEHSPSQTSVTSLTGWPVTAATVW
jgi:hypothetical protein